MMTKRVGVVSPVTNLGVIFIQVPILNTVSVKLTTFTAGR